jgi:hypothetical protein
LRTIEGREPLVFVQQKARSGIPLGTGRARLW